MDTVFFYRLVEAVRQSLEAAGHPGLRFSFVDDPCGWFDLNRLFEYVEGVDHPRVPFLWEGMALPEFDSLRVTREYSDVRVYRTARNGIAVVRGDVAFAVLDAVGSDAYEKTFMIVGERRAGDLQSFMQEYDAYARRKSRNDRWITVIGGKPIPRPCG